ncbi:tetraspannin, putative [Bodo saltans]|uniref:Tetraspannin, putative n=1 Tax=Bodo saltans TaxID=75058 RepID=A0A0S4KHQ2_BODSA|nr:tetraspannin, putative [Bodo saltans]|eukprot:CUI15212.1 tetraspannin, putative [Bodo saltans]
MPRNESKPLLNSGSNKGGGGGGAEFKYGEGGETDEFLAGLTGGKPKYKPKPKTYEPSVDTDNSDAIPSNYYAPDYRPESAQNRTCGIDHFPSRAAMITVAVILMGGGGAIVAFLNHNMEYLQDLWPLAFYAMNALGALFLLVGILSIAAAVQDKDRLRRAAFFVMVLACCGVILGFTLATFVRSGREDSSLLSDWTTMVSHDMGRVCTIEHDLNCTGWTLPCGRVPPANLSHLYHDDEMSKEELHNVLDILLGNASTVTQCVYSCELDVYHNMNQTCSSALQARVKKDYPAAVAALAFALVWTIAFGVLVFLRRDVEGGYGNTIQHA